MEISGSSDKKLRKVIIIGTGTGHNLAPNIKDVDDETELWGCNGVVVTYDLHKSFQIHSEVFMEDPSTKKEFDRINELNIPVMMQDKYPGIPNSVKYPLEEIIKEFDCDYLTNSIDYELAYAIYLGVKEIDMYGINMVVGGEYAYERPGCSYWIGYARRGGIKVTIYGKESSLLKCYGLRLYGYNRSQIEREQFMKNLAVK